MGVAEGDVRGAPFRVQRQRALVELPGDGGGGAGGDRAGEPRHGAHGHRGGRGVRQERRDTCGTGGLNKGPSPGARPETPLNILRPEFDGCQPSRRKELIRHLAFVEMSGRDQLPRSMDQLENDNE